MCKNLWIGSMALALLSATTVTMAAANDAADEPEARSGTARVAVQAGSAALPGQPAQVHVELKQLKAAPTQTIEKIEIQAGPHKLAADSLEFGFPGKPIKLGEYWLGVECHFASEALRAQLGLPEGQGLVVEKVVPESPAAKAGIQRHDVLAKAGEKPLRDIRDLIDAIESVKEKELAIELIRGGEKKTVKATPAKRPEEGGPHIFLTPQRGDWERWLKRLEPGDLPRVPFQFRFFHPGTILPPGTPLRPPLPDNLSVTITKQGDKPAKIVVKRDDEKWELTEKELDKLPEDVRPHVERMLGRLPGDPRRLLRRFDIVPDWDAPGRPKSRIEENLESVEPDLPQNRIEKRLKKQMDLMNRRIDALRKMIDELRQQRP